MKFVLMTIGVAALAGAGAFLATGQPAGPPNPLAGDWRCNITVENVDSVALFSAANDGTTRGQLLFNSGFEGQWVVINTTYKGRIRIEGADIVEEIDAFNIVDVSVDGRSLPSSSKAAMRDQLETGLRRYRIEQVSASKLAYADERERTICERSPVPLNL